MHLLVNSWSDFTKCTVQRWDSCHNSLQWSFNEHENSDSDLKMSFTNFNFGDKEKCKQKAILLRKNLWGFCRKWENVHIYATSVDVDLKKRCDWRQIHLSCDFWSPVVTGMQIWLWTLWICKISNTNIGLLVNSL